MFHACDGPAVVATSLSQLHSSGIEGVATSPKKVILWVVLDFHDIHISKDLCNSAAQVNPRCGFGAVICACTSPNTVKAVSHLLSNQPPEREQQGPDQMTCTQPTEEEEHVKSLGAL